MHEHPNRRQVQAPVVANRAVAPGIHQLDLRLDPTGPAMVPGQFLFVRPLTGLTPLLRRPFGVMDVQGDVASILFEVKGEGTRVLAGLGVGALTDVVYPLGSGWPLPADNRPLLLVAGGLGLPPLLFLARRLHAASRAFSFVYGATSATRLVLRDEVARLCPGAVFCTDDGSLGRRGFVSDHLPDLGRPGAVLTCGPTPMMQAVAKRARAAGHACWASLEEHMACGLGVCMGCVTHLRGHSPENPRTARICVEGPVFPVSELTWA